MSSSKYTKENRERILNLVRAGNHPHIAAISVGVTKPTFYRWQKLARAHDAKYERFFEQIDQAQAEAEARDVNTTARAATVEKTEVQCPQCEHPVQLDPVTLLNLGRQVSAAQQIKTMAAGVALQRLTLRFPKRWSQRVVHTVEEEHNRLLDVAERVLAPEVFRALLEAYLAADDGSEPSGDGDGELETGGLH